MISRKYVVVLLSLACSTAIGLVTRDAALMTAWAGFASIAVASYMGAHAVADSKWSKPS